MRIQRRILQGLLLVCLATTFIAPEQIAIASTPASEQAQILLEEMTPEEKVGQLFLVTFSGTDVSTNSPIYQLIANYHIGGIIISRANGNILVEENAAENTWTLISELQKIEYYNSYRKQPEALITTPPTYIPLLIGLSQEGDNSSHTQILNGVSPIPSQMAIGATWDTGLAQQVGTTAGKELSILGVNLLLGPSLDVLEVPQPSEPNDLEVRTFGGDPYWVGKMGQAYIKGIHEGSQNRILTIGKYFPGLGSADRLPEEEIATVRKSLEQLQQIELAPFFAVTGDAPSPEATIDGLLTSHIRYQGLQGNIRSTTRPISLDPQAFNLLMELTPFGTWHEQGGLMISDSLGSQALRQFYDPTGNSFNARQVALDAFFAGNDVLYLGNFADSNLPDTFTTIKNTLDFFAQKYEEDQTFAERVDESVLRILAKKLSLYNDFKLETVLAPQDGLAALEEKSQIAADVARQGATLISPSRSELNNNLPNPPTTNQRIIIITDSFEDEATGKPALEVNTLQESILRLYGPRSGLLITRANLTSYTYKDIIQLLDFPAESEAIGASLSQANWLIVAALNTTGDRPNSRAFHRLLSERQDLLQDVNVVVFAFNAPYYFGATDISKIDAYYGLYSNLPSFVDVAARLLFKEIPNPSGASPVSIPGIGYDLISATSPDPEQTFSIYLNEAPPTEEDIQGETHPDATPSFPVYNVGDVIDIQTSPILDHNGHPVPDGTPVQFVVVSAVSGTNYLPLVETKNGQAQTSFLVEQAENLQVYATSLPAESEILQISVANPGSVEGEVQIAPTASPTSTPTLTPTNTPEPQRVITTLPPLKPTGPSWPNWHVWGLSFLITTAFALIAYQTGAIFGQVRWGIRWGFSAFIGGMLTYSYLALELPGSELLTSSPSLLWNVILAVLVGSSIGWGIAILVRFLVTRSSKIDKSGD